MQREGSSVANYKPTFSSLILCLYATEHLGNHTDNIVQLHTDA